MVPTKIFKCTDFLTGQFLLQDIYRYTHTINMANFCSIVYNSKILSILMTITREIARL